MGTRAWQMARALSSGRPPGGPLDVPTSSQGFLVSGVTAPGAAGQNLLKGRGAQPGCAPRREKLRFYARAGRAARLRQSRRGSVDLSLDSLSFINHYCS
jgi:hypothetical protein